MPQTFQTTRRAEFRDTDAAGIVHFSVYFQWMEQAEHEFLRHVGLSVFHHDEQGTITWPRVAARCDYQQSIRFEETAQIEVRVIRLGGKSVTYDFHFRGPHGPLAVGEITAVCCRVLADGSLQSLPIPDWISAKLRPYVTS
jgi:4-hydroxybenzoyl-CoA thioesterase/acyl-CoA thioester hydrolase